MFFGQQTVRSVNKNNLKSFIKLFYSVRDVSVLVMFGRRASGQRWPLLYTLQYCTVLPNLQHLASRCINKKVANEYMYFNNIPFFNITLKFVHPRNIFRNIGVPLTLV